LKVKRVFASMIPVVAVHVGPASFAAMTAGNGWLTDEDGEGFKKISSTFPASSGGYASNIRDALARRKDEGHEFALLVSLKDEKIHLMTL
jgi:translation initiation factor 2-alpha kinase 4